LQLNAIECRLNGQNNEFVKASASPSA